MCEGRQGREVLLACWGPPVGGHTLDRERSSIENHFEIAWGGLNVSRVFMIWRSKTVYVCIVFGRHWVCIIIRVSM